MREKKFTWDAQGVAATGVATIAITATLVMPAAWAPLVTIVDTLVVALVLRARRRCDWRDGAAALVAVGAVLVALAAPSAAAALGIASSMLIALSIRQR
jgi:hypothetical protein